MSSSDIKNFSLFAQLWFYSIEFLRNRKCIFLKHLRRLLEQKAAKRGHLIVANWPIPLNITIWPELTVINNAYVLFIIIAAPKKIFYGGKDTPLQFCLQDIMKAMPTTYITYKAFISEQAPNSFYSLICNLHDPSVLKQT